MVNKLDKFWGAGRTKTGLSTLLLGRTFIPDGKGGWKEKNFNYTAKVIYPHAITHTIDHINVILGKYSGANHSDCCSIIHNCKHGNT